MNRYIRPVDSTGEVAQMGAAHHREGAVRRSPAQEISFLVLSIACDSSPFRDYVASPKGKTVNSLARVPYFKATSQFYHDFCERRSGKKREPWPLAIALRLRTAPLRLTPDALFLPGVNAEVSRAA